jgi:hypothetical protein
MLAGAALAAALAHTNLGIELLRSTAMTLELPVDAS